MGFYDNPIIDDAAKNSEASEIALRMLFNMSTGFICRVPTPDKGCDFNIELINGKNEAAKWEFGVQLKSTQNLHLVDGNSFISFPISTSRLGYLSRSIPVSGLLIIHHSDTGYFYFSEVNEIVFRLYEEKNSDWENQQTVNVKIPIKNKLNPETVKGLHGRYTTLFKSAVKMQNAFGERYGLPKSAVRETNDDYDFNNPVHIATFLQRHGTEMLMNYEVNMVGTMVRRLTNDQISANTKLICLAAISNGELGAYDLSELQCIKAIKRRDITADDRRLVEYALVKNQFHLGKIRFEELEEKLLVFETVDLSPQNKLTLRFNILYFKLAQIGIDKQPDEELQKEIMDLFDKIDKESLTTRVRLLLTAWNADNFSSFINALFIREMAVLSFSDGGIKAALFSPRIAGLNQQLLAILKTLRSQETSADNLLIRAHALQIWVKHYLHLELTTLNMKPSQNNFEGQEKILHELINMALTSYNYFQQEGSVPESYVSLCYALEFIELGKNKFEKSCLPDEEFLLETKKRIEEDSVIQPYQFQVKTILKDQSEGIKKRISQLGQKERQTVVTTLATAKNITENAASHMLKEIETFQEFHIRCKNPDIELKPIYHSKDGKKPSYLKPTQYFLLNKKTGIESLPSLDFEQLLRSWGL